MTFASGGLMRNCDCDECNFVPLPIADAIRQHKRMSMTHALPRTQNRTLVARQGLISIWRLTMPVDAEPLMEFGNSHRIVLIDSLSAVSLRCTAFEYILPATQAKYSHIALILFRHRTSCRSGKESWDLLTKQ
jgi:hypothetical protein